MDPPPRSRWAPWLAALLPVALTLGVATAYVTWWDPAALDGLAGLGAAPAPRAPGRGAADAEPPPPPRLRAGRDYYLFIRTAEFYPQQSDGSAWDRIGGAAPDLRYSLAWQGLVVYESPVRNDTLIGLWDPINIDLASALPLLGEGKLELASTLNQGAIVTLDPDREDGGVLTVNFWDQDSVGLGSDAAGQIELPLAELREGDNVFHFEQTTENAVKRVVLGATDTADSTQNLLRALSQP